MTLVAAIVTTTASCAGKTSTGPDLGTIDSHAELAQLMNAAALPMARLFTLFVTGPGASIIDGTPTLSASAVDRSSTPALTSPVSCPSGGSAAYAAVGTTQITFTNCNLGGVVFSSGSLTMSGGATGTLSILDGLIQWSIPVTDVST